MQRFFPENKNNLSISVIEKETFKFPTRVIHFAQKSPLRTNSTAQHRSEKKTVSTSESF
jgi:hypothetical protein